MLEGATCLIYIRLPAADVSACFHDRLSAGRRKVVAAWRDLEEGTPLGDGRHARSLLAVGLGTRDSNQYR